MGFFRLTNQNIKEGNFPIKVAIGNLNNKTKFGIDEKFYNKEIAQNILLLKATGTKTGQIKLENIQNYGIEALIGKISSRNQIQIIPKKNLSIDIQIRLIELFNTKIQEMRNEYFSLFMTNFRDKGRKRISFDFTYRLLNYLYFEEFEQNRLF